MLDYRAYVELMRHWDAVLPGRVMRLCYEDVVADVEGSVQRLLQYCDLRDALSDVTG
jgi:Sulfotransferase family